MKVSHVLPFLAVISSICALPQTFSEIQRRDHDVVAIESREAKLGLAEVQDLWKRKGGGGSGSRGGSGGSSTGGSSTGGSSSGGSSSGSSSSSSGYRPSSGGYSSGGSGVRPTYGGRTGSGSVYGGGASAPYTSGSRSAGGISPFYYGAGFGLFPGLWLYGAYSYPYVHPWNFHNATTNANQTKPVQCLCEEYQECGCEENTDSDYQATILGDGSYSGLNKTLVTVADINGTSTILINGTLPNGTTADSDSAAGSIRQTMMQSSSYWILAAVVGCAVFWI